MIGVVALSLLFWIIMGWMLVTIHNQDTNDDLSPLIRDARPGEERYKYYGTQLARSVFWPVAFVIVGALLVPELVRYLREPVEDSA